MLFSHRIFQGHTKLSLFVFQYFWTAPLLTRQDLAVISQSKVHTEVTSGKTQSCATNVWAREVFVTVAVSNIAFGTLQDYAEITFSCLS